MADAPRVKVGTDVSDEEHTALVFLKDTHPGRYQGVASVLRDYSINEALEVYRRAKAIHGPQDRRSNDVAAQ